VTGEKEKQLKRPKNEKEKTKYDEETEWTVDSGH
jgi:hypothetical protein